MSYISYNQEHNMYTYNCIICVGNTITIEVNALCQKCFRISEAE